MFDVICVGGVTEDLFLNTKSELISIKTSNSDEELIAYPSGSKILVKNVFRSFGGGSFNAAVSLSRLGLKTGIVACVGSDDVGKRILKHMRAEKIKFLGHTSNSETGFSVILDSINEDRTILSFRGSNEMLSFSRLNKKKIKSKWIYLSSVNGKAIGTSELIARYAVKHNIKLFMNPSTYMAKLGINRLKNIINKLNILDLNKEEAEFIASQGSIENNLRWLRTLVKDLVIITDGKNGAFAYDGSYFYRVKSMRSKVVETTGAGDSFASTFLFGFIKTKDIKKSLKLAITNASSVVEYYGAQNRLLSEKELTKRTKKIKTSVKRSKNFIE